MSPDLRASWPADQRECMGESCGGTEASACTLIPIPSRLIEVQTRAAIRARRLTMGSPSYSSAAIREAWERAGKQYWDRQTHGRGLGLLIVDAISAQGTLILGRLKSPGRTFEFWRDQNKIRGRLIGVGNGVVVARLNVDGLPE